MPFDDEGLQLALADDFENFEKHMGGQWPRTIFDLTGATVQYVDGSRVGDSGSSVTVGTGPKTFDLTTHIDWLNGIPLYIHDVAAPTTNIMLGYTSSAVSNGVVNVNVSAARGVGNIGTSWKLFNQFSFTDPQTTPNSLADGGFGVDMSTSSELGMDGVFGQRKLNVVSILSTPPGSPSVGDRYLVGESPTGGWSENDVVQWNGSSWDALAMRPGDAVYDEDTERMYARVTNQQSNGPWAGARYKIFTQPGSGVTFIQSSGPGNGDDGRTFTVSEILVSPTIVVSTASTGDFEITLPSPGTPSLLGATVEVLHAGPSGTLTVSNNINNYSALGLAGGGYNSMRLRGIGTSWWFNP